MSEVAAAIELLRSKGYNVEPPQWHGPDVAAFIQIANRRFPRATTEAQKIEAVTAAYDYVRVERLLENFKRLWEVLAEREPQMYAAAVAGGLVEGAK